MKNPIPRSNMFATPINLAALLLQIDNISNKSERATVMTYVMMTLNTAHNLVEQELENVVDFMERP